MLKGWKMKINECSNVLLWFYFNRFIVVERMSLLTFRLEATAAPHS